MMHGQKKHQVRDSVRKSVLGDSLRINRHSRVFTLFLCRPRAQFRPGLHLIGEVSRSHTVRHILKTGMNPLYKWSASSRFPYLRNSQQTQWTNVQALIGFRTPTASNQSSPTNKI